MARGFKSNANVWVLVLLLLVGGLIGSALGSALAPVIPWLKSTSTLGLKPATIDFHFLKLTFGFTITLGPLTALGFILGYLFYRWV